VVIITSPHSQSGLAVVRRSPATTYFKEAVKVAAHMQLCSVIEQALG
jgi:hypothetical protein